MSAHSLLLVDGYNVIFAWNEAKRGGWSLDESRDKLIDALHDYAGYTDENVVLVFDGYKADRLQRSVEKRANVTVVFTKKDETADAYIERVAAQTPSYVALRVVTGDRLEQLMVLGKGAVRVSSRELLSDMSRLRRSEYARHAEMPQGNPLMAHLTEEQRSILDQLRRNKE